MATAFAVVGILGLVAVVQIIRDSPAGPGSSPRTAAEQSQMLASGDCALAPNHRLLGKVAGRAGPGRALPRGAYVLESIERRHIFQVEMDGVHLVPCRTITRPPPPRSGRTPAPPAP